MNLVEVTSIDKKDINVISTDEVIHNGITYVIQVNEFDKKVVKSGKYCALGLKTRYFVTINDRISELACTFIGMGRFDIGEDLNYIKTHRLPNVILKRFKQLDSKHNDIKNHAVDYFKNQWDISI